MPSSANDGLKHRTVVVGSLQEAGDRLFPTRLPPSQRRSGRPTRRHRAAARGVQWIKTQTALGGSAAMLLFWALLASVQINLARSMAGKRSPQSPSISQFDLAA